ncbi:MAG TPA: YebC/PmpR family DNA-binding transcriptional regulator [Chloroflexi bacterium]|nr:MAG: YebC/PmpR family DNA-binding transcriptional regulator [Chloroflexota bacterium]HDN04538.1 YebC/PmpR family DNA-binding transcriptional regulator [Chloroflexota bacterium]
MSGHSKWSTIKHKKAQADARRGAVYTKLAKEIQIATREGGGDPNVNFGLRLAIDRAKAANMPNSNIERAIKRGTGEDKDAAAMEKIYYEGYAPHGVAVILNCITDNRNRTVSDIRHVLTKHGGSMGQEGSVSWQFTRKSFFNIPADQASYDDLFEIAAEGGADDVLEVDDYYEIIGPVDAFKNIFDKLKASSITPDDSGLRMDPNQEIELDLEETVQVMKVIDVLEELDDVQEVYSNLKITDEALQDLA